MVEYYTNNGFVLNRRTSADVSDELFSSDERQRDAKAIAKGSVPREAFGVRASLAPLLHERQVRPASPGGKDLNLADNKTPINEFPQV